MKAISDIFVGFNTERLTNQFGLTGLDLTEKPAYNGRFCVSRGVARRTSSYVISNFVSRGKFSEPPPNAKPRGRYLSFWDSEVRLGSERNKVK